MSIRIGVSCVTVRDGNPTTECLVAEIRQVVEDSITKFWQDVDFCLEHNIYIIINFDMWSSGGHLDYTELQWRQRVDGLVWAMLQREPTAKKWRVTIENEPMKYWSKEKYAWFINIAYDQIKVARGWTRVQMGVGNEEFSLAAKFGMYEYILQNCQFDYLDIHIQAAVIEASTMRVSDSALNYWGNVAKSWAVTYNKKLSCTEGNWCDVSKATGYTDIIKMLDKAEEIGCEDFCVVFTDYRGDDYCWLSFLLRGVSRSPYWDSFKQEIINRKPEVIDMTEYLRPDELQALYDEFGFKTPYRWQTPNLFTAGQKNPIKTPTWADIDAMEETRMKGLVSALKKIGVLPSTFPDYPNIKYNADGSWNSDWQTYAKSNPKP